MDQSKTKFLKELAGRLGNHPEKEAILLEYETHIDEILLEHFTMENEAAIMEKIVQRLGTPQEIAGMWLEELAVTPSRMKWLFILVNLVFFAGGSLLTLAHNLFEWRWLANIWRSLTALPTLIALVYMVFWMLLGYEIGKGFGHGGRKVLKKTFIISLFPNLLLMLLIVFQIIPHNWFAPLLTKQFILICIFFTIILYPISLLGFRWGKKVSI